MSLKDKEEFMHDWYAILDCDKSSSVENIEKAARKLSVKYHPDKTSDPEAPEKFLLVQKAKEILLDPTKRKVIDDHNDAIAKREAYESHRTKEMDVRRKRMRDEFNERLSKASESRKERDEEKVFQNELKKRSKIIEELRKKSANLMEKKHFEEQEIDERRTKDFFNYRKVALESSSGCCQLKVKWKRTAESHSDHSLYDLFRQFGTLEEAVLVGSKGTSGLVTFTDHAAAKKAWEYFKDSEDYRVSFLDGEFSESVSKSELPANSGLAQDIRRALEKQNLSDIIQKLKKSNTTASTDGNLSSDMSRVGSYPVPPRDKTTLLVPNLTPEEFLKKESNVLERMINLSRSLSAVQSNS